VFARRSSRGCAAAMEAAPAEAVPEAPKTADATTTAGSTVEQPALDTGTASALIPPGDSKHDPPSG